MAKKPFLLFGKGKDAAKDDSPVAKKAAAKKATKPKKKK